jgi:hypothetical protein
MAKTESLPGLYTIIVAEDDAVVWKAYYETALEAAQDFLKFRDHGTADWELVVTLEDPEGNKTVKRFSRIGVKE